MTINYDTVPLGDAQRRLDSDPMFEHQSATFEFLQGWRRYVNKNQGELTLALRDRSGASLLECRAALVRCNWNSELALALLGAAP